MTKAQGGRRDKCRGKQGAGKSALGNAGQHWTLRRGQAWWVGGKGMVCSKRVRVGGWGAAGSRREGQTERICKYARGMLPGALLARPARAQARDSMGHWPQEGGDHESCWRAPH